MTYNLKFLPSALREWKKIAPPIQAQFKKKLRERLLNPRVPSSKLSSFKDIYKIKLRSVGYRLVYEVNDKEVTVYIIAVGKRERGQVYSNVEKRI